MVGRPQRRLLAHRPAEAVPADDPGPDLRLPRGQRRGATRQPDVDAELAAAHADRAPRAPGARPGLAPLPLSQEPQGAGLSARTRRRDDPVRRQRLQCAAGGRARHAGVRRQRPDRADGRHEVPAHRRAALPADVAGLRLLLVRHGARQRRRQADIALSAGAVHAGGDRAARKSLQRSRAAGASDQHRAGVSPDPTLVRRQGPVRAQDPRRRFRRAARGRTRALPDAPALRAGRRDRAALFHADRRPQRGRRRRRDADALRHRAVAPRRPHGPAARRRCLARIRQRGAAFPAPRRRDRHAQRRQDPFHRLAPAGGRRAGRRQRDPPHGRRTVELVDQPRRSHGSQDLPSPSARRQPRGRDRALPDRHGAFHERAPHARRRRARRGRRQP